MDWCYIILTIIISILLFVLCACKISGNESQKEEQEEDINFIAKNNENALDDDITMDEILDQMETDDENKN